MATHEPLVVILEGSPIGQITRDDNWRLRLTFDDGYRNDPTATELSVSMPRAVAVHTDASVTPWLWGLLPDNDRVLDRWGKEFHTTTSSPFGLLGTKVGHDCAGAVQFAPPHALDEFIDRPGGIEWLDDEHVAQRLRELSEDSTAWLGPGFTGQFSLGGAQAKTALYFDPTQGWGLPSGSMPTTHILKPAIVGIESQDLNEHLCLSAARNLGLRAARTRLARFEDQSAIVVERYDRTVVNGHLVRIHQEDLCQASGRHPADKYQSDGGPSPADVVELLRTSIAGTAAVAAVERFVDALIFNWLIAGTDAHAKNYSLLLSGTQVRFAPLYDISSALPYDDSNGHKLRLAMKVGGEYRLRRIDRPGTWDTTARELGLHPAAVRDRALDLAARVGDAFADAAATADVVALQSPLPDGLADLVAARAAKCTRMLGRADLDDFGDRVHR